MPRSIRMRLARSVLTTIALAALVPAAARAERGPHAEMIARPETPRAGEPALLRFTVRDSAGAAVRFLQFVHERPMHLIIVSDDLGEFAHVHPELAYDDAYEVTHSFPRGGRYRMFADYTPPGSGTRVDRFDLTVAGVAPTERDPRRTGMRRETRLVPDSVLTRTVAGVNVSLAFERAPRAGEDLRFGVTLSDSATGAPINDLELYLGALAHFIIVSEDLADFIHAHPLETGEVIDPARDPTTVHVHDPALLAKMLAGPSPPTIHAVTSLERAGRYKMWVQFQRGGRVVTAPFVFSVDRARPMAARRGVVAPANSIRVLVGAAGYEPARIEVRKGEATTIAFSRPKAGNCGGVVVIPSLGIRRELPVGGTILVSISPTESGEIPFQCGMGMLQGVIVAR